VTEFTGGLFWDVMDYDEMLHKVVMLQDVIEYTEELLQAVPEYTEVLL
jgi:hypothetical protein